MLPLYYVLNSEAVGRNEYNLTKSPPFSCKAFFHASPKPDQEITNKRNLVQPSINFVNLFVDWLFSFSAPFLEGRVHRNCNVGASTILHFLPGRNQIWRLH